MKTIFYVFALSLIIAGAFAQYPPQVESSAQLANDINVLQFALTLEHLEAAYYTMGIGKFGIQPFVNAGYPPSLFYYLDLIRTHEDTHVSTLTQVITSLGGNPVQQCTYNFNASMLNVTTFLAFAMVLENTGVSAYDGAASSITSAQYLTAAATIATTEARHAAFLNEVNRVYAFSNASFDVPLNATTIYNMVAPLIVSCPAGQPSFSLPITRDHFAYNYSSSGGSSYNITGRRGLDTVSRMETERRNYETPQAIANDNALLNYALHLENFESAFYTEAQRRFNLSAFISAGYNQNVYNHIQLITKHEQDHAAFLTRVLISRGVTPDAPCVYNYNGSLDSVNDFLMASMNIENVGVTAYDGAINTISDEGIVQAAATIATIEARHADYLTYLLTGQGVQQAAFDTARTPQEVLNITASFFVSCPSGQLVIPQPYYLFATNVAPSTSVTPSRSAVQSTSPSVSYSRSSTYSPSRTPTPTPTNSCPPYPSPCGSRGTTTTINFFFADMLRGAGY